MRRSDSGVTATVGACAAWPAAAWALLPFAQAAATLADLAGIQLSASTVRTVTQGVGADQEQAIQDAITSAWAQGGPRRMRCRQIAATSPWTGSACSPLITR